MKAPVSTDNITDYLHEKVVAKAMEFVKYNLNLQHEDNCPYPARKQYMQKLHK